MTFRWVSICQFKHSTVSALIIPAEADGLYSAPRIPVSRIYKMMSENSEQPRMGYASPLTANRKAGSRSPIADCSQIKTHVLIQPVMVKFNIFLFLLSFSSHN